MKKVLYPLLFSSLAFSLNLFIYFFALVYLAFVAPEKDVILNVIRGIFGLTVLPLASFFYGRLILNDARHKILYTVFSSANMALAFVGFELYLLLVVSPLLFVVLYGSAILLVLLWLELWALLGLFLCKRAERRSVASAA